MTLPLFFFERAPDVSTGAEVALDGAEGHHAAAAMRVRVGESVTLTDGRGTVLDARVQDVSRGEVRVVVAAATVLAPPSVAVTVVQAVAKGDRGERAVELLTEVGVTRIVPWQAERSVSRWGEKADKARAKWQNAADAAAKQSRRGWWPTVSHLADLAEVVDLVAKSDIAYTLHESASLRLAHQLSTGGLPSEGEVTLVVGPEGGVSEAELAVLSDAGAVPVRLGPTVLRTSTAGVVAATLVLQHSPEWKAPPTSDEGAARD